MMRYDFITYSYSCDPIWSIKLPKGSGGGTADNGTTQYCWVERYSQETLNLIAIDKGF